jgi:hypothetical protein
MYPVEGLDVKRLTAEIHTHGCSGGANVYPGTVVSDLSVSIPATKRLAMRGTRLASTDHLRLLQALAYRTIIVDGPGIGAAQHSRCRFTESLMRHDRR